MFQQEQKRSIDNSPKIRNLLEKIHENKGENTTKSLSKGERSYPFRIQKKK